MTTQQPEALRLAELLELAPEDGIEPQTAEDAAAGLRRLHAENESLQAGYAAARLEIESLQARIKTMAEEHADELMVAHLDGRMRAAQPAGAQQPGAAYAELPQSVGDHKYGGGLYTDAQMRVFADATCAMRASHGQAPAQAAPAAAAGPSLQHLHDLLYTAQRTTGDAQAQAIAEARIALSDLMTAPEPVLATRAWPKVSGVSRDEGHPRALLVFFSTEPTDDEMRAVHGTLAAAPTTQPAPQQEAQEPVAWYVTGCGRLLDEDEAKAEARHIGGTAMATPLYTAPQPSPAAQGNALDAEQHEMDAKHAAIYRWMLGHVADVLSIFDNWLADEEADTDELHDALAARAAQKGGAT